MRIANRDVGTGHPPFVIAEMSGNHNQSLDRALEIVEAAAKTGAHAIKLQTYTADTMTLNINEGDFRISDPDSLWANRSLYDLYEEAHTPWEWHGPLFKRARELGLIPLSTPFDDTAVDFLESLDVPVHKIASFENTDIPLIRKVAATGKPVIMSTGMASVAELAESVAAARAAGCKDLILLKCTSTYPAKPDNVNLRTIPHLRELFGCEVGLSDHTMGAGVAAAAVALGAVAVEKHFTLSRADGGVDSAFSAEPHEMRDLVQACDDAFRALGAVRYGATKAEEGSKAFRRSLYVTQDLKAGEVLGPKNLRAIRPGFGLPPKFLHELLGKPVKKPVKRGTPMSWDLV
jgi:N-acetylneuraminate synthase